MNTPQVYGVMIPDGKSSGWLVPDFYRDRFELVEGYPQEKSRPLLDRLGKIDVFYHDSDHSYGHVMFELTEAKKRMPGSGLMVVDDVSWTSATWEFAAQYNTPAFNYRGSLGVIFF